MCSIKDQSALQENDKNRGVFYGYSFFNVSFRFGFCLCCFCCFFFLTLPALSADITTQSGNWTTENMLYSAPVSANDQPNLLAEKMIQDLMPSINQWYIDSWGNYPHKVKYFKCYEYYRDLDEQGCFIHTDSKKYCNIYTNLQSLYGPNVFKSVKRVFTRGYGTCSPDPNYYIGWCTPYDEEGYLSCGGQLTYDAVLYEVKKSCNMTPFYVTDGRTFKRMLRDVSTNASHSNFSQALDKIKGNFANTAQCPTWDIAIPPIFGQSQNMRFTFDFFCWDFFIVVYRWSGYILVLLSTYFAIRIALD